MAVTEQEVQQAEKRMAALRENGFVVSARYDRRTARIVVNLNTGVQVAFPPRLAEGLAGASPADLAEIEISPAGLGLHWPKLDADAGHDLWIAARPQQVDFRLPCSGDVNMSRFMIGGVDDEPEAVSTVSDDYASK